MSTVYITTTTSTGNVDPGFNIYLVDASAGNITLTLPTITSDGYYFIFRRVDTANGNTMTVQGASQSETIDNLSSISFTPGDETAVVSCNNVWWRL